MTISRRDLLIGSALPLASRLILPGGAAGSAGFGSALTSSKAGAVTVVGSIKTHVDFANWNGVSGDFRVEMTKHYVDDPQSRESVLSWIAVELQQKFQGTTKYSMRYRANFDTDGKDEEHGTLKLFDANGWYIGDPPLRTYAYASGTGQKLPEIPSYRWTELVPDTSVKNWISPGVFWMRAKLNAAVNGQTLGRVWMYFDKSKDTWIAFGGPAAADSLSAVAKKAADVATFYERAKLFIPGGVALVTAGTIVNYMTAAYFDWPEGEEAQAKAKRKLIANISFALMAGAATGTLGSLVEMYRFGREAIILYEMMDGVFRAGNGVGGPIESFGPVG
jgi:hypothetical protein